jgi:hypothetical protein
MSVVCKTRIDFKGRPWRVLQEGQEWVLQFKDSVSEEWHYETTSRYSENVRIFKTLLPAVCALNRRCAKKVGK